MRSGLAVRVVDRWVGLYTSALPPAVAIERRNEVLSDVWEEQAAGRRSSDVLRRAVAGLPADLAWRVTRGVVAPWLRPPVRLALTGIVLFCLAVIQHSTGQHTFIGNTMYASSFVCALAAVSTGATGVWGRYRK